MKDLLKLDTEEGQAELARDGLKGAIKAGRQILDSDNPAIKGFLDNMKTADGLTGREALGNALAGDEAALGEFVLGAAGEIVEGGSLL